MQKQFTQSSFAGGMNVEFDASKLSADQYPLLINGRNRFNVIQTINKPTQVTAGLPSGALLQGLYGVGTFLLVFAAGRAYYKDFATDANSLLLVDQFQMSTTADTIYLQAVPSSTVNFTRKLVDTTRLNGAVNFTEVKSASPQCAVVQDGENQPWLIFANGTARVTKTYSEWTQDDREYVPIGKYMVYDGGILYIAGWDNKDSQSRHLNQIYRSVTGRPIDFVVNVDVNGDKSTEGESVGGAAALAHKVDLDDLTALARIGNSNGAILASTFKNSWFVVPDFNNTIFAEPTFGNQYLFPYGAINPFSIADIAGDSALIGQTGIRSFNSALQFKTESQNLPFSAPIARLFDEVIQTVTAATNFDDYALFAVDTIYGPGVLIYDTIRGCWVGLDRYYGVGQIKQFAQIKVAGNRKLFFITTENELYEAFASTEAEVCRLYLGEWSANDPFIEQKPLNFGITLTEVTTAGTIQVTPYIDRQTSTRISRDLEATYSSNTPVAIPFTSQEEDTLQNISFNLQDTIAGDKVGFLVELDAQCKIVSSSVSVNQSATTSGLEQQAALRASYTSTGVADPNPLRVVVFGDSGVGGEGNPGGTYASASYYFPIEVGEYYHWIPSTNEASMRNGEDVISSECVFQAKLSPINTAEIEILGAPGENKTFSITKCTGIYLNSLLIETLNPHIIVGTGDHNYMSGDSSTWDNQLGYWFQRYIDRGILYFALGNHDLDTDNGCVHVQRFRYPNNGRWYKVTPQEGIDLFVLSSGLNTNGDLIDDNTEDSVQALWLKNELSLSDARIKLVFFHHPPYTSGASYHPGYPDLRWPFKAWGVTAVFNGHAHSYERLTVNGLQYLVTGLGGHSIVGFNSPPEASSIYRYNDTYGVTYLEIDKFNIKASFKTVDGRTLDPIVINS